MVEGEEVLVRQSLTFLPRRKLNLSRHSHEVRQGVRFHFPHHVSTMDLDGDFAGPEFRSYLLIEHPGNHQTHDPGAV